ncbi:acyl-phosphate glycerol 3-phosphate acyltransferase [Nesterenkonia sp. AN1]|uniref:lysophospholipid acyltransferase family protein n=1 Tax=Nesterenkonia sp. AN1 TaxID=652017 RepID=UPI0004497448|nr:lysophospholipid acyltransferase family protein [Nesterenkonia sp. AN1]EXF25301.1 acyl-phosphate glycerol 3-phosphate acyltransferase [Nesterenkonia sp. AN1]
MTDHSSDPAPVEGRGRSSRRRSGSSRRRSERPAPAGPDTTDYTVGRGTRLGFSAAAAVCVPVLNLALGRRWHGLETLPKGGFIVVANHVSEVDPLVVAHAVYRSGHTFHFLIKDSLVSIPVLGKVFSGLKQIPVSRDSRTDAGRSLDAAKEVLAADGAVMIYPEGTLTRDPEGWPMRAKTGAARLALTTGAPLIPITHWGVQELFGTYAKVPKFFPRKRYQLTVGEPIDLSDLRGGPMTRSVLTEATERIETALTEGVASLRGQEPPEQIWDRSLRQRVPRRQPRRAPRAGSAATPQPVTDQPKTDQPKTDQPKTNQPDEAQEDQP